MSERQSVACQGQTITPRTMAQAEAGQAGEARGERWSAQGAASGGAGRPALAGRRLLQRAWTTRLARLAAPPVANVIDLPGDVILQVMRITLADEYETEVNQWKPLLTVCTTFRDAIDTWLFDAEGGDAPAPDHEHVDSDARLAPARPARRRRPPRTPRPRMATYRPARRDSLSTDPPGRSASSNNPARRTRLIAKGPARSPDVQTCTPTRVQLPNMARMTRDCNPLQTSPGDLQDLAS